MTVDTIDAAVAENGKTKKAKKSKKSLSEEQGTTAVIDSKRKKTAGASRLTLKR